MPRYAFYSFHYQPDASRASQIRNMGVVDGNKPVNDNDWETVKRGGDLGIERWIKAQMEGKSCVVVLIGAGTAGRKWINYEIKTGWQLGKGVLGIHIHGLKDLTGSTSAKGRNPFEDFTVQVSGFWGKETRSLSTVVPVEDPWGWDSKGVYANIKDNLESWVEKAIKIRGEHP